MRNKPILDPNSVCQRKENTYIDCDPATRDCSKCGWNPEVYEKRKLENKIKYGNVKSIGGLLEQIHARFRLGKITREQAYAEFDKLKRMAFIDCV